MENCHKYKLLKWLKLNFTSMWILTSIPFKNTLYIFKIDVPYKFKFSYPLTSNNVFFNSQILVSCRNPICYYHGNFLSIARWNGWYATKSQIKYFQYICTYLFSGPLQPEMTIPYIVTPMTYLLTLQDHNYYKNSLNNMWHVSIILFLCYIISPVVAYSIATIAKLFSVNEWILKGYYL